MNETTTTAKEVHPVTFLGRGDRTGERVGRDFRPKVDAAAAAEAAGRGSTIDTQGEASVWTGVQSEKQRIEAELEDELQAEYEALVADGLSDQEARALVWPEPVDEAAEQARLDKAAADKVAAAKAIADKAAADKVAAAKAVAEAARK